MKKHFTLLCVSICFGTFVFAQSIVVDTTVTAADFFQSQFMNELINTDLLPDTAVSEMGAFTNYNPDFPLQAGFILSTGRAVEAEGPNNSGSNGSNLINDISDEDLNSLVSGSSVNDVCKIEFDFIPITDTIRFKYIFGSEEFPEFANSSFNDVMGMFLSGPGIEGLFTNQAINIALLPNGQPVTIDNVYNNQEFYVGQASNDNDSNPYGDAIQFDGASILLTAEFPVIPGQVYHLKIAIGDTGDSAFDSSFLMESVEFQSGAGYSMFATCGQNPITQLYEGIPNALVVERGANCPLSSEVHIEILVDDATTATVNEDFVDFSQTITLAPNQMTDTIYLNISDDDIEFESEIIMVKSRQVAHSIYHTPYYKHSFNISDNLVGENVIAPIGDPVMCAYELGQTIQLFISDPDVFVSYQWGDGSESNTLDVTLQLGVNTFYVTATDIIDNVYTEDITIYCSNIEVTDELTNSTADCDGSFVVIPSGGVAPYTYSVNDITLEGPGMTDLCPAQYLVDIVDSVGCSIQHPVLIQIISDIESNIMDQLSIYPNPSVGEVNIDLTNCNQELILNIYSQSGNSVFSRTVKNELVTTPELPSGIYYLSIIDNNGDILSKSKLIVN